MDAPATKPAKKAKAPKKVTPKKEELTQAQIDALNNTTLELGIGMDYDEAMERDYINSFEARIKNGKIIYYDNEFNEECETELKNFDIFEMDEEGNPVVHTDEVTSFSQALIKAIAKYFQKSDPFKMWALEEYHITSYVIKDSDFNPIDEDCIDIDVETIR